jgi:hypothetical protein
LHYFFVIHQPDALANRIEPQIKQSLMHIKALDNRN